MASYETMPSPSAATETKPNVKRLVICAAALSFALGARDGARGPRGPTQGSLQGSGPCTLCRVVGS